MIGVAEEQLKRVRPGRQAQFNFSLPRAEMEMIVVSRNGLIERRQVRVDQKMMMTRIQLVGSRRSNPHAVQAEMDCGFGPNSGAVFQINEIHLGVRGRWGGSASRRGLGPGRVARNNARQ